MSVMIMIQNHHDDISLHQKLNCLDALPSISVEEKYHIND